METSITTLIPHLASFLPLTSSIFTILALSAGVLSYFYGPLWGVRKVPGPPAIPLVGHLPLLAKHGPDLFSVLAKKYGPVFRFHMGRQPLVIVADAELCRQVGIKKFKEIPNRSIPSPILASPLHRKGLFWIRDSRWSTMRNTILSMYQPSHLAKLVPMMQSFIETANQNLPMENDQDINLNELSLKMATDVIGKAAFGFDFGLSKPSNHQDNDEQIDSFVKQHIYSTKMLKMDLSASFSIILGLLLPILQEPFRQILKRIPYTMDWKFEKTNMNLNSQLDEIVVKKMEDKERGSQDFLSLILNARESETASTKLFTPDYISGIAYEHLLAGSATTSFTLSSAVYLISGHPEVEKKLLEEIDAFGPRDQVPTADDLQSRFPYLDQVVKESMRFFIVSPLVARETSTEVEIGGYVLPKPICVKTEEAGVDQKSEKKSPCLGCCSRRPVSRSGFCEAPCELRPAVNGGGAPVLVAEGDGSGGLVAEGDGGGWWSIVFSIGTLNMKQVTLGGFFTKRPRRNVDENVGGSSQTPFTNNSIPSASNAIPQTQYSNDSGEWKDLPKDPADRQKIYQRTRLAQQNRG